MIEVSSFGTDPLTSHSYSSNGSSNYILLSQQDSLFKSHLFSSYLCLLQSFAGLAIALNSSEVYLHKKENGKWVQESVLSEHDLRVTSIDWAKKTNKIVTCSAVC